jgi:hypothetical protein
LSVTVWTHGVSSSELMLMNQRVERLIGWLLLLDACVCVCVRVCVSVSVCVVSADTRMIVVFVLALHCRFHETG